MKSTRAQVSIDKFLKFKPHNEVLESVVKSLIPNILDAVSNPGSPLLVTQNGVIIQGCNRQEALRRYLATHPEIKSLMLDIVVVEDEVAKSTLPWLLNQTSTANFLPHLMKTEYGKQTVVPSMNLLKYVYGPNINEKLLGQLATRLAVTVSADQETVARINANKPLLLGGNELFSLKNDPLCNKHFANVVEDRKFVPLAPTTISALQKRLEPLAYLMRELYRDGLWQAVFRKSHNAHYTYLSAALNGEFVKNNPTNDQVTCDSIIRKIKANRTKLSQLADVEKGKKTRENRLAADTLHGAATDFNANPTASENSIRALSGLKTLDERNEK